VAERLADSCTVVTYDRRGTGRSGSRDWPSDSGRHADDALALISNLGLDNITVFGASAGGIVALSLALRHPTKLKTVLCYEPGVFTATEDAEDIRVGIESTVQEYLRSHPDDWSGAMGELGRAAANSLPETKSLFAAPSDKEWFALRTDANAESLIRGDLPLARERFDPEAIANSPVNLRFAYGTASLPVFEEIASQLAAIRGEKADAVHGMGHLAFYQPEAVAAYIRSWI
ncbi:MAG: alpha/beta hydrolase, partial [Acidimicrobiia bacterium]